MHDAGNPVKSRFFLLAYISVTFKNDYVAFSSYDSVNENISSDIAYKGYCAFAYIAVSPWSKGNLVAQMEKARVHAIALCCEGYAFTFSNKFADFYEYNFLIYCNLLCHFNIS